MRKKNYFIARTKGFTQTPFKSKLDLVFGVLDKSIHSFKENTNFNTAGFTLIELLVTATILVVLAGGAFYTLNPFGQIEKGQDAQRRQDLQQIKNALESYYQDNNCYPEQIPFGEEWSVGETVYMQKVPQDDTCSATGGTCYQYTTDTDTLDNCPQWSATFAKLSAVPANSTLTCPLSELSDACIPEGYDNSWACTLTGAVNCPLLAQSGFGYDSGSPESSQITPTQGVQPTPTLAPGSDTYALGGNSPYNPYLRALTISPVWPQFNNTQTFILAAQDGTSNITVAKIHLYSDTKVQTLTLSHSGGTLTNGTWSGTIAADTYNNIYAMAIEATNANGNSRCTVLTPGGYHPEPDQICADINN